MRHSVITAALAALAPVLVAAVPFAGNETLLNRRSQCAQDQCDTQVGFGSSSSKISAKQLTIFSNPPSTAAAFDRLWSGVESECGTTECGLDSSAPTSYCTPWASPDGSSDDEICILASGSFGKASKASLMALAKEVFYRSITRETPTDEYYLDYAVDYIHVVAGPGSDSGYDISFNFKHEIKGDFSCPAWVKDIEDAGALVPEYASVFGAIGLFCDVV